MLFSPDRTAKRAEILVVESDEANREVLQLTLTHETSYQCYFTANGREALRVLRNCTPNLFLLDFHLPDISCLDLSSHIQNHPRCQNAAILIMTSLEDNSSFLQRNLPFIEKPFSIARLLHTLEKLLISHYA
jgi:CheY-like chemotaxis protein